MRSRHHERKFQIGLVSPGALYCESPAKEAVAVYVPTWMGTVTGLLFASTYVTVGSGSVLPGMLVHFLCRVLPMAVVLFGGFGPGEDNPSWKAYFLPAAATVGTVLAGALVWRLWRRVASLKERRTRKPDEG